MSHSLWNFSTLIMFINFIIYLLLLLLIFINGAVQLKRHSTPFIILITLIGLTFLSELIGRFLAMKLRNSMPVYHVISVLEYTCITLIYLYFLKGKKFRVIKYLLPVLIICSFLNSLYIQGLLNFPSNSILLFQIVYLCYALLGLIQMLKIPNQILIRKQSFFWLNISLLFYSSTQLLFFGLLNYAIKHHLNLNPVFTFSFIINLIYYSLLAISIRLDRISPNRSTHNEVLDK